jgi:hypothetical protein
MNVIEIIGYLFGIAAWTKRYGIASIFLVWNYPLDLEGMPPVGVNGLEYVLFIISTTFCESLLISLHVLLK